MILNGYEHIDKHMFLSLRKDSRTRRHDVTLVKDKCRLDMMTYYLSLNEWNTMTFLAGQQYIFVLHVALIALTAGDKFLCATNTSSIISTRMCLGLRLPLCLTFSCCVYTS